jgi:hypothetical protein
VAFSSFRNDDAGLLHFSNLAYHRLPRPVCSSFYLLACHYQIQTRQQASWPYASPASGLYQFGSTYPEVTSSQIGGFLGILCTCLSSFSLQLDVSFYPFVPSSQRKTVGKQ